MITINKSYFKLKKKLPESKLVWKDREGNKIPLSKMKRSHLSNLLRCFTGHSANYKFYDSYYYGVHRNTWIQEITRELKRRSS